MLSHRIRPGLPDSSADVRMHVRPPIDSEEMNPIMSIFVPSKSHSNGRPASPPIGSLLPG